MSLRSSASSRIRARDPLHPLHKDNYKTRDVGNSSQTILDRLNASIVQRKHDHPGLLPAGFCPTPTGFAPSKEASRSQKSQPLKLRQLLSTSPEGSPVERRHSSPQKVFNLSLSTTRRQAEEGASTRMLHSATEARRTGHLGERMRILPGLAARPDTASTRMLHSATEAPRVGPFSSRPDTVSGRQETISEFWEPDVSVTSASVTTRSELLQHLVPSVDEACVRTDQVHEQAVQKPVLKHSSSLPESATLYGGQRSDTLKQMRKSWNLNPGPATPSRWSVRQSIDPFASPGGAGNRASELQTALDALGDLRQPPRSWTAGGGAVNIANHGASEEKPESYSPTMPDLTRWMQDQEGEEVATTERHFTEV